MTTNRTPIQIHVQPWFQDHCFGGKIVLPAVETLLLLAGVVQNSHPEVDIRIMEHARFARFLEIPPGNTTVDALVECKRQENGSIRATLLSRVQFKAMARIIEHGEILFPLAGKNLDTPTMLSSTPLSGPVKKIAADRIYRELVPFGPVYHTLKETLFLSHQGAWGKLKPPELPDSSSVQQLLGSPFPLDGAMHAACVHGQQQANFVPFPVGFDKRVIRRPTKPGNSYITRVVPISQTGDELIFNLGIFDKGGQVYETVTGIRMQDVSRGMIKPPAWIRTTSSPK